MAQEPKLDSVYFDFKTGMCLGCGGRGGDRLDTGGTEPWGEPISVWVPCPICEGRGYANPD